MNTQCNIMNEVARNQFIDTDTLIPENPSSDNSIVESLTQNQQTDDPSVSRSDSDKEEGLSNTSINNPLVSRSNSQGQLQFTDTEVTDTEVTDTEVTDTETLISANSSSEDFVGSLTQNQQKIASEKKAAINLNVQFHVISMNRGKGSQIEKSAQSKSIEHLLNSLSQRFEEANKSLQNIYQEISKKLSQNAAPNNTIQKYLNEKTNVKFKKIVESAVNDVCVIARMYNTAVLAPAVAALQETLKELKALRDQQTDALFGPDSRYHILNAKITETEALVQEVKKAQKFDEILIDIDGAEVKTHGEESVKPKPSIGEIHRKIDASYEATLAETLSKYDALLQKNADKIDTENQSIGESRKTIIQPFCQKYLVATQSFDELQTLKNPIKKELYDALALSCFDAGINTMLLEAEWRSWELNGVVINEQPKDKEYEDSVLQSLQELLEHRNNVLNVLGVPDENKPDFVCTAGHFATRNLKGQRIKTSGSWSEDDKLIPPQFSSLSSEGKENLCDMTFPKSGPGLLKGLWLIVLQLQRLCHIAQKWVSETTLGKYINVEAPKANELVALRNQKPQSYHENPNDELVRNLTHHKGLIQSVQNVSQGQNEKGQSNSRNHISS